MSNPIAHRMTKTTALIWLSDSVVYPPTEQPDEVSVRPTGTFIRVQIEGKPAWIMLQTWLRKFNPHPIGSEVERECPTCEGKGNLWEGPCEGDEMVACWACRDGTQKRRILSVKLTKANTLFANMSHDEWAEFYSSKGDFSIENGERYLIAADTVSLYGATV